MVHGWKHFSAAVFGADIAFTWIGAALAAGEQRAAVALETGDLPQGRPPPGARPGKRSEGAELGQMT